MSLPKSIVQTLGLSVRSKLNLTLEDGLTLEQLLAHNTKSDFVLNDENGAWIDAAPVGKEI